MRAVAAGFAALTLVATLACNQTAPTPKEFAVNSGGPPPLADFRIATWNVHQGYSPDPTGRMPQWDRMMDELAVMEPNVVVMQETVSGLDTNDGLIETQHARDLAQALGGFPAFAAQLRSGTVFPHLNAYEAGLFGNSTVSLLPYESFVSFPLSDNRTVLVTRVAGTEIANVHFTAGNHKAAAEEARELLHGLRLDGPTIIAGDFNAQHFDRPLQYLFDAGYVSCASVGVDHVLVSPHFRCGRLDVVDDELSDHPRIVVDVYRNSD